MTLGMTYAPSWSALQTLPDGIWEGYIMALSAPYTARGAWCGAQTRQK